MDVAIVYSRALSGIHAPLVTIEVHLSRGLPGMSIVGLPEAAVRESKDRVRSALINNQFEFPLKRITVNLAPADLPKQGGRHDLPIAIGILVASGQLPPDRLARTEFIGELALTGELRPVTGALPVAMACRDSGRQLILPSANADEAALTSGISPLPASSLQDVAAHLAGMAMLAGHDRPAAPARQVYPDLADVRAQHQARRALEIAAAGRHNLLMIGPPGTGKTMLAERLPGILPPLTDTESLESAAIHSVTRAGLAAEHWGRRPFRAPHHTASAIAMVGGGSIPRPGEISLAHHGVLFLDELPEYERRVLDVLREPLESGRIIISRAASQVMFPARFQLVAAMNPCPCGYHGDPGGRCLCSGEQIRRYAGRLSGPLLDRIDLQIEVPNMTRDILLGKNSSTVENTHTVAQRVLLADSIQKDRADKPNHYLDQQELLRYCRIGAAQQRLLDGIISRFNLSARSLHRILKVARTIADLEAATDIADHHLAEAIGYRRLERLQQ